MWVFQYMIIFLIGFSLLSMKLITNLTPLLPSDLRTPLPPPPRVAYFISGSTHEDGMLQRLLLAVYHPHNVYIVSFNKDISPVGHQNLSEFIHRHPVFSKIGNVKVIARSNIVCDGMSVKASNVLHAADILLKEGGQWDWLINLDASSYPLVTQDGNFSCYCNYLL